LQLIWEAFANALKWIWDNILKPLADFFNSTFKPLLDAVGGFVKWCGDGIKWLGDQLGKLCFKHATPLAEKFGETLENVNRQVGSAAENIGDLSSSLRGVRGAGIGVVGGVGAAGVYAAGPPIPAMAAAPVSVNISAPLVNVEGSADRRTAEMAVNLALEKLKTVVIEATSSAAPTKRIRVGSKRTVV
jgi:hypothetical protein